MFRKLATALCCLCLAAPVAALDLNDMSPEDRAAFGAAVRSYLLDNPQVIMDAVAVLEERRAAEQAAADVSLVSDNAQALFEDGFSYVGGNPEGDITVVEFLDYRCGFCRRAHPEVSKLMESDGNIRLIIKEFPILGDQSVMASRFAVATKQVAGDDAYKAVSDALIDFTPDITIPALMRIAQTLELDGRAIEAHMNSDTVSAELQATRSLAQNLQITGTPTFVLHDELLRGYLPYDQMKEIVAEKRE